MAYLEPGIYHIKNVESGLFAGRAINEDYSLAPKRIVGVCEKPSQVIITSQSVRVDF
jgi:hypothetical protein